MGKKKNFQNQKDKDRQDKIEIIGTVIDALPGTWFKVKIENGHEVLATLSGKMRQNHILVLPGDQVIVEVSPYDMSRGRVSRRL
ncbi:translation initiation factor IF-1 [Candidatus Woesearchaeota archaeon]|nr:translation initiation factor IF-1 [Candidatus Woesearchaeota archaeon]